MTFSEFAKALFPFCGAGRGTADFVLSLIEHLMEIPPTNDDEAIDATDNYNPLAELSPNTLEKIYNGDRDIAATRATQILNHLDKSRFEEYIDTLSMDSLSEICKALNEYGISATPQDVSAKCANAFVEIITRCATKAGKPHKDLTRSKKASTSAGQPSLPQIPMANVYVYDGKIYIGNESIKLPEGEGQVIIIENDIPTLDYEEKGATVYHFTKGKASGRYGFLNGVF